MFVIQSLSSPFFKALAVSLVYSLWQAAFLFFLAWLILRINKNAPARLKYNIAYFAQAGSVIWFMVTLLNTQQLQSRLVINSPQIQQSALLFNPAHLPLISGLYNEQSVNQHINFANAEPLLLIIYLLGLSIMALRTLNSFKHTQTLKYKGLKKVDNALYQSLRLYVDKFQVTRNVRIYLSELVHVPIMLGHLKPIILLPISIMTHLSMQQIEAIIMHEVAHIRRMDYLLNLFQVIVETIFFFNPFIWLLSNIIRDEREKACDELVIKEISPYTYASALLALETARSANPLAMAAIKKPSTLLSRIKLFTMKQNQMINIRQKAISLCLIVTSICCIAWFTPGHAQDKQAKTPIQNTKTNQKKTTTINSQNPTPTKKATATLFDTAAPTIRPIDSLKVATQALFKSDDWKKQVAQIQQNALRISKAINNNPDLQKQLKDLQEKSMAIQHHYNDSSAWKQPLMELQRNAQEMAISITHNQQFKNQLKALQDNASKIAQQAVQHQALAKNTEDISQRTTAMVNALVNNKQWKDNLKNIETQATKMSTSFENNPEWQKNLESITKQAQKIADQFTNNPAFEKQIKELTEQSQQLLKTVPKEDK